MGTGWYCPHCNSYHAPFVATCPNANKRKGLARGKDKPAAEKIYICPECGLPEGQCDPDGIGHYRG